MAEVIHEFSHNIHTRSKRVITLLLTLFFSFIALIGLGSFLNQSTPVAVAAPNDLTVEILAGYNLVVDSNVLAPSTYAPSVATVAGRFCNNGATTLTDVQGYIGNFLGNPGNSTPGIYPRRYVTDTGFASQHPHLDQSIPNDYYVFSHVGGRVGTADATRFMGNILPGECRVQYWHLTYPRRSNPNNTGPEPVWGQTNVVTDDLWLNLDIWGTANDGTGPINASKTWTMTMRNEISAMANKIQPNPNGVWFNTNTSMVAPGDVITSNGIFYELGNINKGFDNDGDFVPDYNAWLQPVGDPGYDPSCFRLIRVNGELIVSRSGGNPTKVIPFSDQLYFTNLPTDNTGVVGIVRYTFLALGGPCSTAMTPYQEVASGYDNEKFNADYGVGIPPIVSFGPQVDINKSSNPNTIDAGSVITYQIPFQNNGTVDAGLGLSTGGVPLVISDTIPVGTELVSGTASANVGVIIRYSTDKGASWSQIPPTPASSVTTIQWWLTDTLPAGNSGSATFQVLVPGTYSGSPVIENCADASFGAGTPFAEACAPTLVNGANSIGDLVWKDDNSSGGQDAGESGIPNVTVSLYFDQGTTGTLDSNDFLVLTTTSSITGFYRFDNLPDGNYLVIVDNNDPDLPFGYGNTTPSTQIVSNLGQVGDEDYTLADFGFGPVLRLDKKLISSDPAYENQSVIYTIDLVNTRPGNGTGQGIACTYYVWSDSEDPDHTGAGPKVWSNIPNAFGAGGPNNLFAQSDYSSGSNNLISGRDYNLGAQTGNIVDVTAVFQVYLDQVLINDFAIAELFFNNVSQGTNSFTTGDLNNHVGIANVGFITWNVTGLRGWDWLDFASADLDMALEAQKANNADPGNVFLDAMGFQITTDQTCGGSVDTINPLPLTDTYDATKFDFISAVPTQSSVQTGVTSPYTDTGVISWANLGPLYGGQTKVVTLTFTAKEPAGNVATTITNTVNVTNATFLNGKPVHGAQDTVTTTLQPTGSIGDFVWSDSNGNGIQDTGENGIPNVVITLTADVTITVGSIVYPPGIPVTTTTDASGAYSFDGLLDGNYTVVVDTSTIPGTSIAQTGDPDEAGTCFVCDSQSSVTISGANDASNLDFGYTIPNTIFGNIWEDNDGDGIQDAGENGLSGITVELNDGSCTLGTNCPITTTDASGNYVFTNQPDGTYSVVVNTNTLPSGVSWSQTADPDESAPCTTCDSQSNSISVSGGNIYGSYDFAYTKVGAYNIGDKVYADWDGDGTQDVGEAGIDGVTVSLYEDSNGDGVINPSTDALISTTVSTNGGTYLFTGIPTGTYIVLLNPNTLPANFNSPTGDPDEAGKCSVCDNDGSATVNSTVGSDLTVDFGYQPSGTSSIGDLVWRDEDGDGNSGNPATLEPNESGLGSITVELWADINSSGIYTRVMVTSTNASGVTGTYIFNNLPPGKYQVRVDVNDPQLPAGVTSFTYVPSTNSTVSLTLSAGQSDVNADFGFTGPGQIGDTIFWDANQNGTEDLNESGISGVVVTLTNNVAVTISGVNYAPGTYQVTDTTDVNGQYLFGGLPPASYTVSVDTNTVPGGGILLSDPDSNGIACNAAGAQGCDNQTIVTLTSIGQKFLGADFGYDPPGEFGDFVWNDVNGNGIQEPGEPGLAGVVITATSPSGTFTTTTDINGAYSFNNLANDSWTITFQQPANMVPTVVIPAQILSGTGSVGASTTVVISGGNVTSISGNSCTSSCSLNVDSGFVLSGANSISGTIFFDTGNDGNVYSPTVDSPYQNISVFLYDGNNKLVGTTTTDANGFYQFASLPNGNYTVAIDQNNPQLTGLALTTEPDVLPGACGSCNNFTVISLTGNVINQDFGYFASMDFGDLPSTYATTRVNGGPYHILTSTLYLGGNVNAEGDGTASPTAASDSFDDGVKRDVNDLWTPNATVNLFITVTGGTGRLAGWFDFNEDGDFNDTGEFVDFGNIAGTNVMVSLTVPSNCCAGGIINTVNVRFRLFDPANIPGGSLDIGDYVGMALYGEVEDYQWTFDPTSITLLNLNHRDGLIKPNLLATILAALLGFSTFSLYLYKRKQWAEIYK